MENRFEYRAEAGGEQGHDKSDKRTWRERFAEQFERKEKAEQPERTETPHEKIGFAEFVRDIFKKEPTESEAEKPKNFIDQAFDDAEQERIISDDEKLANMGEQDRTEFLMVVAQRFKDAGERFMSFVRREPQLEVQAEAAGEASISPEIRSARAMYEDEYEDDLSSVPELEVPAHEAPPFDFAVDARAPSELYGSEAAAVLDVPLEAGEIGSIDDFDYAGGRDAHVERTGEVTRVEYRPRLRDVLFASAVGTAYGRRELHRSKQEMNRKLKKAERHNKAEQAEQAKEFKAAQQRLREEQIRFQAEVDKVKRKQREQAEAIEREEAKPPVVETLETVREAAKHIVGSPADAPEAVKRMAEQEAKPVRELQFKDLKPKAERIEETPDNVFVKSIKTAPHKVSGAEIENPLRERLMKSQQGESRSATPEQQVSKQKTEPVAGASVAADQEAISVREIIAGRTDMPKDRTLKQQIKGSYDIDTPSGAGNWIATAVILGLILIGLLFISAV